MSTLESRRASSRDPWSSRRCTLTAQGAGTRLRRMNRTTVFALLTAAAVSACAKGTPEQQIVDDAAAALGGRDRVLAVKTLVIEGEGIERQPRPGHDARTRRGRNSRCPATSGRSTCRAGGRASSRRARRTSPTSRVRRRRSRCSASTATWRTTWPPNGNATRASNAAGRDRRAEIYHHPITIVRAALDPAAKLANARTAGDQRVVDITTANGLAFTLAIDGTSELPTRVVSMSENTNMGDVAIETSFADYQDVSGLKLPSRLTTKTDKYTTAEIRVTKQTVDGDAGDLAAPAAAASRRAGRRTAAGNRHRRGSGQGHLAACRPVASQRARRVHRSPDAHRSAAERYADARRHREGPGTASRQAADARRQLAPSLRSLRRHPRRGVRGPDGDRRTRRTPRIYQDAVEPGAHDRRRTRSRRTRSR